MSSLFYDRPASTWLEALPLGNGSLGAMAWGGVGIARFDLNEETVWSGSPASEAGQGIVDAVSAAELLVESRKLLEADRPAEAASAVMKMQSAYGQAYLPLGQLEIDLGDLVDAPGVGYRRELDLGRAIHHVYGAIAGEQIHQWSLVAAPHGVLMHVVEGLPATVDPQVRVATQLRVLPDVDGGVWPDGVTVVRVRMPSDVAPAHEPAFPALTYSESPGTSLEGAIAVRVIRDTASDGTRRVAVLLCAATTYDLATHGIVGTSTDAAARAIAQLDRAAEAGIDAVAAAHIADHGQLFGRVELELAGSTQAVIDNEVPVDVRLAEAALHPGGAAAADPALLALLFDYGRYLLISCSRPGGLPPTLQGIWNNSMQPPWSSSYTLNINFEMNHWATETVNLSETGQPLVDFVTALASQGQDTASRLYGVRGWVAHHNSDAWLMTSPVGAGHGDPSWAFWPMAGPWLVRTLWDAVEFGSTDDTVLRTVLWPLIRSTAEFLLDWTIQLPDGTWGTSPSTSPENTYLDRGARPVSIAQSSAMDLALVRDLLGIVASASQRLGLQHDPVSRRSAERLTHIAAGPAIGIDGALREWKDDVTEVDPHHRHVSHLYPIYPGTARLDPVILSAAEASLERRGDDSTGWSLAWKLSLWARLHRPDRVSDLVRLVFRQAGEKAGPWAGGLYPNLLAAHPPFQIDGNLGYVAAIAEMLVQSHRDEVELLPSVPNELQSGRVSGLVARPGIIVGIIWTNGELVEATVRARTSAFEGPVIVRYRGSTVTIVATADADARVPFARFTDTTDGLRSNPCADRVENR